MSIRPSQPGQPQAESDASAALAPASGPGLGRAFLPVVAVLAVVSRLPFLLRQPDWGGLAHEHGFFLAAPRLLERLRAIYPNQHIPFWMAHEPQYRLHFHRGSPYIGGWCIWLSQLLGVRTLVVLKLVGLLHFVPFMVIWAWALRRAWPRSPHRQVIPLLLAMAGPGMFLWSTLMPMGHLWELPVFYALCLPALLLTLEGRTFRGRALGNGGGVLALLWVGIVGGVASAYTLPLAPLVGLVLTTMIVWGSASWKHKLVGGVGATALWAALWAMVGNLLGAYYRLLHGEAAGGDYDFFVQVRDKLRALWAPHTLLGGDGFSRNGLTAVLRPAATSEAGWQLFLARGVLLIFFIALGSLLLRVVGSWRGGRRRRAEGGPGQAGPGQAGPGQAGPGQAGPGQGVPVPAELVAQRFLVFHGLLGVGYLCAWLIYPVYAVSTSYLVPLYLPVFVGIADVVDRFEARGTLLRRLGRAAVGGFLLLVALQWGGELRHHLRDVNRPPMGAAALAHVENFYDLNQLGPPQLPGQSLDDLIAVDLAEIRCRAAFPDLIDTCRFITWTLRARREPRFRCQGVEPDEAEACARALGAGRYGPVHGDGPLCMELAEGLRPSCEAGAFQGSVEVIGFGLGNVRDLCGSAPVSERWRSACYEQVAGTLPGLGGFGAVPATRPLSTPGGWPRQLWGTVDEIDEIDAIEEGSEPACEDLYAERFASALPTEKMDIYELCLFYVPKFYPACAIGISRRNGEHDCRWRGDPGFWERQL